MNGYLVSPFDFRREVLHGFSKFGLFTHQKAIDELILENSKVIGMPALGYFYNLNHFGKYKVGERSPQLHPSLKEKGQAIESMLEKIRKDESPVYNFLTRTLNMTREERDLRILLPDCLGQYLESYCQPMGDPDSRTKRSSSQKLQEWFEQTHDKRELISTAFALHILIV